MMRLAALALSMVVFAALALVGSALAQRGKSEAPDKRPAREILKAAKSWGYQLQNISAAKLDATSFDVLIVDAGMGVGDNAGLKGEEIKRLKTKPDGSRRLVIAYVNIGEAEDYRYYWQASWTKAPPPWMGSPNCRWKGDHRVRHWAQDWQAIVYGSRRSYLGRLIDLGYDGAWLDRVDIFYYWRGERWQAADDMVRFVTGLSEWAKKLNPQFLIVPQNGEELLSDARYRAAIDGMGKEDMLFGDRGNDVRNAIPRIQRARRNFEPARRDQLPVLAVEYARRRENIAAATRELNALGFVPYSGPRSLAYIGQDGPRHNEDGDTEATVSDQGDDESCG